MLKASVDAASLNGLPAKFRFPAEFYQPNAVVSVTKTESAVSLGWPSGDVSPLIPTSTDHYVDRAYGVPVELIRDDAGRPASLKYDKFVGELVRK